MSDSTDIDPNTNENDNLSPEEQMQQQLLELRSEHRRIDKEIKAAIELGAVDQITIQRMKKIKLLLKDKIAVLENQLTPDIIA